MKTQLAATTLLVILVCAVASAQTYQIRVTSNTNLRASYSLDSEVLASASAGATLQVVGRHNRWLQITRAGRTYWMADWVSYARVGESAPTQPQPAENVDNCCYVDRQCNSDQDWINGWHAFQNGQCAAPAPSQAQSSAPLAGSVSSQIDNCCFAGWQCNTDQEWVNGYQAYQENRCAGASSSTPSQIPAGVDNCCLVNQQCATDEDWQRGWAAFKHYQCRTDVPVSIEGGAGFRSQILESFLMLQRTAPYWYDYAIRGLNKVAQSGSYAATYVDVITKTFFLHYADAWPTNLTRREHIVFTASILVHEACHVHRHEAGLQSGGLPGERACTERQLEAHVAMDPHDHRANEHRETLATIHDPSTWWW